MPAGNQRRGLLQMGPSLPNPLIVLLILPSRVFFFLKIFFFMWTIFKVFIESVTILLLFYVCLFVFCCKACRILAPQPRIELTTPALEGEALIAGLPGMSLLGSFLKSLLQWTTAMSAHLFSFSFRRSLIFSLETPISVHVVWVVIIIPPVLLVGPGQSEPQ